MLAAISYISEHLAIRTLLIKDYPLQDDQEQFCTDLIDQVSQNSLLRLVADHILRCPGLQSGTDKPKLNAFLLYFSQVYQSIAKENLFDLSEQLNQGDFLVALIAVVQCESEQVHTNYANALVYIIKKLPDEKRKQMLDVFSACLAYFQKVDVSLANSFYKAADKPAGSGFALLFGHFQRTFSLYNKVLDAIDSE